MPFQVVYIQENLLAEKTLRYVTKEVLRPTNRLSNDQEKVVEL